MKVESDEQERISPDADDPGMYDLRDKEPLLSKLRSFNLNEFLDNNKIPLMTALVGLILLGLGVFLYKNTGGFVKDKIEVLNEPTRTQNTSQELVVEIAGAVEKPGVYKLNSGSRIDDLLIASGGLSADADRDWVEKIINRAGKLSDGQKIYVKSIEETADSAAIKQTTAESANNSGGYQTGSSVLGADVGGLTNINTASFAELDKLPGIGQVYGTNIIEQRPYSEVSELLSRGVIPKSTYEKIKDKISVY